ncbi:uncharacterized protein TrAFT101_008093 [Trichoderma asperellum]|uniref:RING-type E3 ubiquitin transferase n=1 Tax=Trichoderma asperellum (strain ATCC 204424 / CBS 433.97 / NBRC 101777) TaxID=1042311 RepID=A0A2T3Z2S3_TRIA4|nr:hypothetical protein M441DRAFT_59213 [Trichoderma asperellum CBS 433.97]PTB39109.1 hypothetical protein M441DRAFT_59213 [Trichoderma asperellum CBS 433.97]UKZ93171.1 hypothetical protein TrAFT101_008093 [Trichoderma asperellum]
MTAPEGAAQNTSRGDGSSRGRGRGGGGGSRGGGGGGAKRGGRGSGNRGQGRGQKGTQDAAAATLAGSAEAAPSGAGKENKAMAATRPEVDDGDDDAEVCFICANPVAHHSIAPCNHKTCHICGLRMRALYKVKDCAHCRTPASYVIFTDDAEKRFEDYTDKDFTTTDTNIGIKYTNEDIVGDTVLLLRYNCPDESCDFAGLGWADLHRHVKSAHHKRMCDLCTRNKKVFTHEHELFGDKELEKHMRHGDDKPGAADQTGFKGHPLCGFCGQRFYDDDKLFEHCRMKHERCFLCDRRDSRQPHYFLNYEELEKHFKKDHFLCSDRGCLEKKFVVFESELDMQAHNLAEHAGKHVGRDARLVDISAFDIRQSYQPERRGGQREGRAQGRARGNRGRDPNEDSILPTVSSTVPLRRDELAFQRQMAIASAPSGSNRTFRGQLSTPTPSTAPVTPTLAPTPAQASSARNATATPPSRPRSVGPGAGPAAATNAIEALSLTDSASLSPEERARLVRHGSVIERAANLLGNDAHKMAAFRSHISTYRQDGFTAPQLIEAFFALFSDASSNALATLVRELADLFEDKSKADNLRKAWQDWRAINEDYPSLPGLGGMQGATSSSSGWASAAAANTRFTVVAPSQRNSNRVLKLKNSTRLGGPTPTASRGPPGWVAASSSSSSSKAPSASAFPSLPTPSSSSSSRVSAAASAPSWTASSSSSSQSRGRGPAPPNTRAEDAFPALPAAPKPQTTIFGYGGGRGVRRDFGQRESDFQWGASSAAPAVSSSAAEEADDVEAGGKGKKGKKGKKQILVQWG